MKVSLLNIECIIIIVIILLRMSSSPVRCVLVGDEGVGKTSLLISYTRNRFPEFYVPTILDNLAVNVEIRNKTYTLALFDTNYPNQSDQCLLYADVFLLCFTLNDLSSFQNVEKWHSIVKLKNSSAKVILVGMKSDLREDSENLVSTKQGENLAKTLGFTKYVECSAKTLNGVGSVFNEVILSTINQNICEKIISYFVLMLQSILKKVSLSSSEHYD